MNNQISNILACVDFSPYSLLTLEYALEFVKQEQTQVIVLNVINQHDIRGIEMAVGFFPGYFEGGMDAREYIKQVKKERNQKLRQMIKDHFFEEKSRMTIKIETGIPYDCILKAVEAEKIDLVVMANKGRSNIGNLLVGSCAEKVFRHSPVPVVSVRRSSSKKDTPV